jgi:hypothetical protein
MSKPIAVGDRVKCYSGYDHPRTGAITELIYTDGKVTHAFMEYEPASSLVSIEDLQVLLPSAERIAA